MASVHNFRSAFHGFNREDVVHYIEYSTNRNRAQIEQLTNQLQSAQARAEAAETQVKELEEKLSQIPENGDFCVTDEELEAYRRAERAERLAQERAQLIYDQANSVLTEATANAHKTSDDIGSITDRMLALLEEYRRLVMDADTAFRTAADALDKIEK